MRSSGDATLKDVIKIKAKQTKPNTLGCIEVKAESNVETGSECKSILLEEASTVLGPKDKATWKEGWVGAIALGKWLP